MSIARPQVEGKPREALHLAIRRHRMLLEEQRHARGYALHPVEPGEFDVWTNEQSWGEL